MSRWVRIDVNLFNHPFFASKDPRSDLEAWAWLIANVAWKDTTHRIGSEMVSVPAGSIYTTLRHLQNQWHWKSDKRVRSFLARLQREDMIMTKTDAGKTHISICNYREYQEPERKEDAAGTQSGRKPDAQKTPIHQNTITPISSSLRSEDKPARKKAVRMPNDFEPDLEFAMGEGLSLSEAKKEVEAMRDWSVSSPNGAKLDWPATWRGWIRRRAKDRPASRPTQKPQSKFADYQDEARRQIDNALGIRDNEPSNYAFDLEPTNWRSQ